MKLLHNSCTICLGHGHLVAKTAVLVSNTVELTANTAEHAANAVELVAMHADQSFT